MTILFAGGGTGGHLYPAIAIAEEIRNIDASVSVVFVGTKKKMESRVVPQKGYPFYTVWISGFSRRWRWSNVLFPLKVIVAVVQSFFLIKKIAPDVVVGTGGYVCGPVLYAASLLRIPTVVHESNSYPGVTTRLLADRVTKVFVTFAVTRKYLSPGAVVELHGNPTRGELSKISREEACIVFGLDPKKRTVFAFGGSLGASSINAVMPDIIRDAVANDYQVIWQTGETDVQAATSVPPHPNIKVLTYVERMDCGYAAADLIISRSGATTLAEITRLGKPAILVPYPLAAANHQELNAGAMVETGAAVMIRDAALQTELLPAVTRLLRDDHERRTMSDRSAALGKPDAGRIIAEKILEMAQ